MGHTTDTINTDGGLSIDDIRAVLAVTSTDLGTLCSHPRINPWARYKPVSLPVNFTDGYNNQGLQWWQGRDGYCGFKKIGTISDLNTVVQHFYTAGYKWEYQPPTGGAQSPYRIGDFRGYYHAATPPFGTFYCPEKVAKDRPITARCMRRIVDSDNPKELQLTDIQILTDGISLTDCYFGIAISNPTTGKLIAAVAGEDTIQPTGLSATQGTQLKITPFLSTKTFTHTGGTDETGVPGDARFIPIPGKDITTRTVTIVSPEEAGGVDIHLEARALGGSNAVTVVARITATSGSLTIYNVQIQYINTNGQLTTHPIDKDYPITIPQTKSEDFRTKIGGVNTSNEITLHATIGSRTYTHTTMVIRTTNPDIDGVIGPLVTTPDFSVLTKPKP